MDAVSDPRLLEQTIASLLADPSVIDEVMAAARATSPEVARLPMEENRRHIEVLVTEGLRLFGKDGDHSRLQEAAAALGADRAAQRVPIKSLLLAVQAARTRAVQLAVARGRTQGVPDAVIIDALLLDAQQHAAEMSRFIVGGHHAAELELARSARSIRTRLLQRLLRGEVTRDELDQLGLDASSTYRCLLSNVSDPAQARAVEGQLAGLGVVGMVDGHLVGVVPRLPDWEALDDPVFIVAGPAVRIDELSSSYRMCAAAMDAVGAESEPGLHHVGDLAVATALAAQPELATAVRDQVLAGLEVDDEFHRQLAVTALAYLGNRHRLDHTAAALHLHPNTVRYRLSRLREITGMHLDAPNGAGSLPAAQLRDWWALRTWLATTRDAGK